jgi:asparagine synthase (glutamine-hydrolysing)
MFRYLVLVWNDHSTEHSTAATRLEERVRDFPERWMTAGSASNLRVFCVNAFPGRGHPIRLGDSGETMLGTVFQAVQTGCAHRPPRRDHFNEDELANIRDSHGRSLITNFWGSYVAVLRDCVSQTVRILRAPMGALPCFMSSLHGVQVVFSHMEDAVALGLSQFTINWDYLRFQLVHRLPLSSETGLVNVTELGPGECLELLCSSDFASELRKCRTTYWNPTALTQGDVIEDFSQAVSLTNFVTRACVQAWAHGHSSILHQLSGGLDSSVVLRCLSTASIKPRITCINWYDASSSAGDEREFARVVASISDCHLVEQPHRQVDLRVFQTIRPSARPTRNYTAYASTPVEASIAQECEATAIFCGAFGDCLFSRSSFWNASAEYVARRGIRLPLVRVALDAAECGRLSVWTILFNGIRDGIKARSTAQWTDYLNNPMAYRGHVDVDFASMVHRDALGDLDSYVDRFVHPWFNSTVGISPAKLWMISALHGELLYHGPFSGLNDPNVIPVLGSQPLVELCLRVSADLTIKRGVDRAVAREAFSNMLPHSILTRDYKGTVNAWLQGVVKANIPFVREFLLDGLLVRERLLDPERIERVLSPTPTRLIVKETDIIKHMYNEAWLRRWYAHPAERVAA